jgi:large subunit ribosomal protein L3
MKFIVGKKIEMSQIWINDQVEAVTRIQAGPCFVTQIKTLNKDGYEAVQVGFDKKKEKNTKKPQIGHLKAVKAKGIEDNFRFLREFNPDADNKTTLEIGDKISAGSFAVGDVIEVSGVSKGRGFQGVVKRHHFQGGRKSHGNKDQLRMPGSTGATGAGHVFKGTRKPGRMGNDTTTIKNSEILEIDTENNIISIRGGVPGARNGLVMLYSKGDLAVAKPAVAQKEDVKEEIKEAKEEVAAEVKEEVKK